MTLLDLHSYIITGQLWTVNWEKGTDRLLGVHFLISSEETVTSYRTVWVADFMQDLNRNDIQYTTTSGYFYCISGA